MKGTHKLLGAEDKQVCTGSASTNQPILDNSCEMDNELLEEEHMDTQAEREEEAHTICIGRNSARCH